jgi:hypothetical protein
MTKRWSDELKRAETGATGKPAIIATGRDNKRAAARDSKAGEGRATSGIRLCFRLIRGPQEVKRGETGGFAGHPMTRETEPGPESAFRVGGRKIGRIMQLSPEAVDGRFPAGNSDQGVAL